MIPYLVISLRLSFAKLLHTYGEYTGLKFYGASPQISGRPNLIIPQVRLLLFSGTE